MPTDPLLISVPDVLRGQHVVVRPFVDADAPALFQAIDESREHLAAWMPWARGHTSLDDALQYIRRSRAQWVLRERLPVAIFDAGSGALLGGSGLERITYYPGFDAFPMFSSDGKKLVWASNRNGRAEHETNIFIADWVE